MNGIVKLINNKELMAEYINSKIYNIIAWATVIFVIILTVLLLVLTMGGLFR